MKCRESKHPPGESVVHNLRRQYEPRRHVQISTYKGKILFYMPGMDIAAAIDADDADAIAAKLKLVARARRKLDAYGKKHKIKWVD